MLKTAPDCVRCLSEFSNFIPNPILSKFKAFAASGKSSSIEFYPLRNGVSHVLKKKKIGVLQYLIVPSCAFCSVSAKAELAKCALLVTKRHSHSTTKIHHLKQFHRNWKHIQPFTRKRRKKNAGTKLQRRMQSHAAIQLCDRCK